MYKKKMRPIGFLIVIVALVIFFYPRMIGTKPFAKLKAEDVAAATVRLIPPDTTAPVYDVRELVAALNEVVIDDVTYVNTGNAIPVEPDESVIEYVEIPVGGDSKITAYAWLNEGKTLVCLVDHEWYEFSPYATLLTGKVLELADGKMLIKPDDKIGAADTAVVIVPMVNMHPSPEPVVGDRVEVVYNGTLPTPSNDNGTPVYDLSGNHIEGIQVVR